MVADYRIARSDEAEGLNVESFEFACDHVAAEVEEKAETAELIRVLSNARHAMSHLMGGSIPAHLVYAARELDALVRQMADRVDAELQPSYSDARDAA